MYFSELIKEKKIVREKKKKIEDPNKQNKEEKEDENVKIEEEEGEEEYDEDNAEKDKLLTQFAKYYKFFEDKIIPAFRAPAKQNKLGDEDEESKEMKEHKAFIFHNVKRHIFQLRLIHYMQYPKRLEELSNNILYLLNIILI